MATFWVPRQQVAHTIRTPDGRILEVRTGNPDGSEWLRATPTTRMDYPQNRIRQSELRPRSERPTRTTRQVAVGLKWVTRTEFALA